MRINPSPTRSVASTPALIAFSLRRRTTNRSTIASSSFTFDPVQLEVVRQVHRFTVDDEPPYALLAQLGEDEVELLAVDLEHRRAQLDLGAVGQAENRFDDLRRGLGRRDFAAARAVRLGDRRVEQVQVARDVGHRADGAARVARDRLLLDRDHRRQPEDEIDVRFGHLRHEPLGVARQRLHVAALPFAVDRVEGEARLARSRESGDDHELVARNLERDVLEVVDARALHGDRRPRGSLGLGGALRRLSRHYLFTA